MYVVLDTAFSIQHGYNPINLARRFFDGGARLLQLRAKETPAGQFLDWADAICAAARECDATVIINDRVDIALMAGAAGVHLGQEDMPADAVRALAPPGFLIGLSTHTAAQIAAAAAAPVDYLAIGPVFGTATKETGYGPVGLGMVRAAALAAAGRPVVAIGGITLDNAVSVMDAGASSVAVISDLLSSGDPAGRIGQYLRV